MSVEPCLIHAEVGKCVMNEAAACWKRKESLMAKAVECGPGFCPCLCPQNPFVMLGKSFKPKCSQVALSWVFLIFWNPIVRHLRSDFVSTEHSQLLLKLITTVL